MTKALVYAQQALAHAGFAVLNARLAVEMRPDLWADGLTCSAEFGQAVARNAFANLPGIRVTAVLLRTLKDEPFSVEVVTRAVDRLEERLTWLTGCMVLSLKSKAAASSPVASPAPPAPPEDRYHGVVTRESGVTCSDCSAFTAAHSCLSADQSGTAHPAANVERRCLAFTALWDATDKRAGPDRWPELLPTPCLGDSHAPV